MTTLRFDTLDFIDRLLPPLFTRAQANKIIPNTIFKDQAAELLIEKFELDYYISQVDTLSPQEYGLEITKCSWIDQCVLDFFKHHPFAIGVNLSCGLNTRFHRLSQQLDWPRFRWADIDTPEIIAFNQGLLPNIDNYRAIGCDLCSDDWIKRSGWKPGTPIIIIEKLAYASIAQQLQVLCKSINSLFIQDQTVCIHLILDYAVPDKQFRKNNHSHALQKTLASHGLITSLITMKNLSEMNTNRQKIPKWLSLFFPKKDHTIGIELSLTMLPTYSV